VALPLTVGPLLTVLFTSRSGERAGNVVREQFKLLGLYTLGLMLGAAGLLVLRDFCVKLILGKSSPEAAAMIGQLASDDGLRRIVAGARALGAGEPLVENFTCSTARSASPIG
jgi:hypothetical protein